MNDTTTATVFLEFANTPYFMPTLIVLSLLLIAIVFIVIRTLKSAAQYLAKKKFSAKLGDKEISYDGSEEAIEQIVQTTPIEKLASTISTVINYAIETGYDNCRIRQSLYESQMRNIRNNFDLIVTSILDDYMMKGGQNYEVAKVLLNHAIDTKIIQHLSSTCKADRMAEKTKERVVEYERSFIDSAFFQVKQEMTRLARSIQKTEESAKFTFDFQDEILLKALENQEQSLKRQIVNSLESAYDDAVKYLEEVQASNDTLHSKIDKIMKTYLETSEHDKLPKEDWLLDRNTVPPNKVVGE